MKGFRSALFVMLLCLQGIVQVKAAEMSFIRPEMKVRKKWYLEEKMECKRENSKKKKESAQERTRKRPENLEWWYEGKMVRHPLQGEQSDGRK